MNDERRRRDLDARLARLRPGFALRLATKLQEVVRALERIAADPDAASDHLPDAFDLLHRIAGTAGSYGFEAIGQAASDIERGLSTIASDTSSPACVTRRCHAWADRLRRLAADVQTPSRLDPRA